MKFRHILIASAALAIAPAAFAQEEVQGTTEDCASLQAQFDSAASNVVR